MTHSIRVRQITILLRDDAITFASCDGSPRLVGWIAYALVIEQPHAVAGSALLAGLPAIAFSEQRSEQPS
jgi:hypothetical protein